jgi:hypothetical protein
MKPHGRLSDSAANRSLLVHLINVEPDPDWIMRSAVIEGLKLFAAYDLTFDYVGTFLGTLNTCRDWPSAWPTYASSSITWANLRSPMADLSPGPPC